MVELTKEEFQILWLVEEGNGIPEGIVSFLEFSVEDVKHTLLFLKKYGLIHLETEGEFWTAKTTKKAQDMYAQYEHWIP